MAAIVVLDNESTYSEHQLVCRSAIDPRSPNAWQTMEAAWSNPAAGNCASAVLRTDERPIPARVGSGASPPTPPPEDSPSPGSPLQSRESVAGATSSLDSVRNTTALSVPAGANATTNFLLQFGLAVRKKSGAAGNPRCELVAEISRSAS